MRTLLAIFLIAAILLAALAIPAEARGPRERRSFRQRAEMRQPMTPYDVRRAEQSERYPRYIGGIHVRELDRFGLPPGDHGPRGNGFYATPW